MPTEKEIKAYAVRILAACDVADENIQAHITKNDPRSWKEKQENSVDYSDLAAENTTEQVNQIKTLANDLLNNPNEEKFETTLKEIDNWKETPSSDNEYSTTSILTQVMPFERIETPVQARERHLKKINYAIQDFEQRLMKAAPCHFDSFLTTIQTLKEQALQVQPNNDESVKTFTMACNHSLRAMEG
jgi:t-SNARE complex subunit (syntaxin)